MIYMSTELNGHVTSDIRFLIDFGTHGLFFTFQDLH